MGKVGKPRAVELSDEDLKIAELNNLSYKLISYRVRKHHWTKERAISTPKEERRRPAIVTDDVIKVLHILYIHGFFLKEIAEKVGIPEAKCKKVIEAEKRKNPNRWPVRESMSTHIHPDQDLVVVKTFDCTECGMHFTHEHTREFEDLRIACPVCATDEFVLYKGLNVMFV